jgi:hypothetical protein
MTETLGKPAIPDSYRDAFHRVVATWGDWSFGGREPMLLVEGRELSVSDLCRAVVDCSGELPEPLFDVLCSEIIHDDHPRLKEALGADRSYATAARCLLELANERIARDQ